MTAIVSRGRWSDEVTVVGNLNVDLILHGVAGLPQWGRETTASGRKTASSGQAGLLAMSLGALGLRTRVIANVGGDEAGIQIRDDLAAAGVQTTDVEVAGAVTGLTVALVRPDGERAFVTDFGSLARLDESTVRRHSDALIASKAVCFVGLFMLPSLGLDVISALAQEAQARSQLTVVDPGWDPEGWRGSTVSAMRELFVHTDLLLVNDDESAVLTGHSDHEQAAAALQEMGAKTVVVKRGGQGAHARCGATVCDVGALPIEVKDTVGAGDTFNAGFLAAHIRGGSLAAAMTLGSAVAGIYCSRTHSRFPSLAEAESRGAELAASERTAGDTVSTAETRGGAR